MNGLVNKLTQSAVIPAIECHVLQLWREARAMATQFGGRKCELHDDDVLILVNGEVVIVLPQIPFPDASLFIMLPLYKIMSALSRNATFISERDLLEALEKLTSLGRSNSR